MGLGDFGGVWISSEGAGQSFLPCFAFGAVAGRLRWWVGRALEPQPVTIGRRAEGGEMREDRISVTLRTLDAVKRSQWTEVDECCEAGTGGSLADIAD